MQANRFRIAPILAGLMMAEEAAGTAAGSTHVVVPSGPYSDAKIKYHFKKDELGNKRPSLELDTPQLTLVGLAEILNSGDEKQIKLVLDQVNEIFYGQVRTMLGDDANFSQDSLNARRNELTWEFIANIPPAERKGGGIAKETWDAFAADYIAIMPGLTGRDKEKVTNAATILTKRFAPVKTVKPVLRQLGDYLDLWFTNTSQAEDFSDVYKFLSEKCKTLLAADEAKLLENI